MNLPLIAALGAGIYFLSQSNKPKASSKASSIPSNIDKGYTIIIPCKMFDIYNEEASYEYAHLKRSC